ncbi:MAG: M23 family metallopeptidase [Candidatus Riflebacteria bacterium]|nr:M23 family metallopeptidase [Candidatus Riflebacteria bacterium]
MAARKNSGQTWDEEKATVVWTQKWVEAAIKLNIGANESWLLEAKEQLNKNWSEGQPISKPVVSRPDNGIWGTDSNGTSWRDPCPDGILSPYDCDDGCDIHANVGTPVYAARDGWIVYNDPSGHSRQETANDTTGAIRIRHEDGKESWYAHLSARNTTLTSGMFVKAGNLIGKVGIANGVSHLHFSIFYSSGGDGGGFMGPY